ncbi:tyrosine-type recombinase/integrase [Paractinoplanes toevensis]|uniref:Integrase n=1 Tax=Paractinoplanes toevensis TaxID=571911 RepID=A0A920BQA0_9ACTN|nr:site-specific integrase [Actinoplanes toevensis]GIM96855.1 hypothetical protein Ato02nite_086480 [Actinoplanes toevensis]
MSPSTNPPAAADVEAARMLLERLGVSPSDLLNTAPPRPQVPTFTEYIQVVRGAVGAGTLRMYGSYWKRIDERWGSRRLDEPTPSEIKQFAEYLKANRTIRRNGRGGKSTVEHFISALRCVYRHAIADGILAEGENPALKVEKPRRQASNRRAIGDARLQEINEVAAATGDDPELDCLLIRFHTETACRRGGALTLLPADLDPDQCLVRLKEKGETERWQPVSPTLMRALLRHIDQRPAAPTDPVFRYRSGKPITRRRYDYIWTRIGKELPWVAIQQISAHWIRHTTLTWVERTYGYAIARAFAGHADSATEPGATATYVRATLQELAAAVAALTGEPHPLAQ